MEKYLPFTGGTAWLGTPYLFSATTGVKGGSTSCGGFVVGLFLEFGINVRMNGECIPQQTNKDGTKSDRTTMKQWTATGEGAANPPLFDKAQSKFDINLLNVMDTIYYDLNLDGCVDHASFDYGQDSKGNHYIIHNSNNTDKLSIKPFERYSDNTIVGVKDYFGASQK